MHPRDQLAKDPDRPALIMAASGERISFAELDARANRCGHLLRARGLVPGDRVAIWMDNIPAFFDVCWGAHNAGLLYVPVSARLTIEEAAYIVRDCDAKLVIASAALDHRDLAEALGTACDMLVAGGPSTFEAALAEQPAMPLPDEERGAAMVYSSGTTGRPKGITPVLEPVGIDVPPTVTATVVRLYGFDPDTVYLSTAPLYHTAPLKFSMSVQQAGGTVVIMERFEARAALAAIERYRVTHSQWVPTMFVRLLALPKAARSAFDLSTHRLAIHSAAPCPVDIKTRMLDWWGPIIHEYYGGSESVGMCAITPEEWRRKPGSVGRASRGRIHILDEEGGELPPKRIGLVYFEGGSRFEYHKDEAKTARSVTREGWGTFGDIGYVDEDGYLFLTDRRDHVINSGGVNIYPQEAENVLASHPAVADVAVFGIPHTEYGEEVKAVVQPADPDSAGPELEAELIEHCRSRLASNKCPRSIDFEAELPREPTGKLLKRLIKARYWPARGEPNQRIPA
ncbi:acyl-CoA synthetase [Sphingosinicella terrae]|uniref:acyl-CoA synthetase n=1 Tax=Sphingosinicella terrae TaxID=2172047 RepID=UPI000E0DAEF5|nr:acyl-CoA synthetase [Sphingosinicella terrae]